MSQTRMKNEARTQMAENLSKMLSKHALGKPAAGSGFFDSSYTEWQTFTELEFVEINGTLQADISKSFSYHLYYSENADYHEVAELEFKTLAKVMGIQFDDKSDFHGKLIISDPASIQIFKKFLPDIKPGISLASSSSTMSRLLANSPTPTVTASDSADPIQQLKQLEDELEKAKLELAELNKRIEFKKETIKIKMRALNPGGVIRFKHDDTIANRPGVPKEAWILSYSLSNLMKSLFKKFHVESFGEWDINTDHTITLGIPNTHEITPEAEEAARFLLALDIPMQLHHGAFGYTEFKLTQEKCDAAREALSLLEDLSPAVVKEIDNRPRAKC